VIFGNLNEGERGMTRYFEKRLQLVEVDGRVASSRLPAAPERNLKTTQFSSLAVLRTEL
jgi:hypothetical protein